MNNLDLECAEAGASIATKDNEDEITKSLGVLQDDGVYAFFLFCKAKEYNVIVVKAVELLASKLPSLSGADSSNILDKLRDNLCAYLDNLLLAKDLLERALVYARYHAKAKAKETGVERR